MRFELVKLSSSNDQSFAGMSVTVIDPNGQTKQITSDASGIAVLKRGTRVARGRYRRGSRPRRSRPVAIRESSEAGALTAAGPATLRLPLVNVEPKEVVSLARLSLREEVTSNYSDIDASFVSTASIGESYGYRIKLQRYRCIDRAGVVTCKKRHFFGRRRRDESHALSRKRDGCRCGCRSKWILLE